MRHAVGVLALLLVFGCNRDEAKLREQAEWLCRYNQIENPTVEFLPDGVRLEDCMRTEDVAYLREKAGQDKDNPLVQQMRAALAPAVIAVNEVMAKHTECKIAAIEVKGDTATLSLASTRPKLNEGDVLGKLGDLAKADSKEARLAKVDEWVKASNGTSTTPYTLAFVRTAQGWRASYDLKAKEEEKKRAEELAEAKRRKEQAEVELRELAQKKAVAEKARVELAKFVVTRSRFRKVKQMFGDIPSIEMSVRNDTGHAISRAYMRGTLASPGRSVPWLREEFNYSISGGIEPGESADWNLQPNMFSEWGKVTGAPDMVLTIDVLRLDGADGQPLYKADFDDEDEQRMKALEASLSK